MAIDLQCAFVPAVTPRQRSLQQIAIPVRNFINNCTCLYASIAIVADIVLASEMVFANGNHTPGPPPNTPAAQATHAPPLTPPCTPAGIPQMHLTVSICPGSPLIPSWPSHQCTDPACTPNAPPSDASLHPQLCMPSMQLTPLAPRLPSH